MEGRDADGGGDGSCLGKSGCSLTYSGVGSASSGFLLEVLCASEFFTHFRIVRYLVARNFFIFGCGGLGGRDT